MAALAAAWKPAWSSPGTWPFTSRAELFTFQPSPTLSKVTAQDTSRRVGGVLARASPAEKAMAKQAACAEASSSSGEVFPLAASVRAAHDTGSPVKALLPIALTVPLPVRSSPSHTTAALLTMPMGVPPVPRGDISCWR